MGKGGNANPSLTEATVITEGVSLIENERKAKIAKAPKFYWATGDALEEPHVER
jgi:uncharacterized protein YcfL